MKKFILSAVLIAVIGVSYAQSYLYVLYTPPIDRRFEIGFTNTFNIYSFDGAVHGGSTYFDVENGQLNPGIYLGYGRTRSISDRIDDFTWDSFLKIGVLKGKYTLIGESWGEDNEKMPISQTFESMDIYIQQEFLVKYHFMDDQMETALGFALRERFDMQGMQFNDLHIDIYPQAKFIYKLDKLYFSGLVGFDLLKAIDFDIMDLAGFETYSFEDVDVNPVIVSLSVGYLF